MFSSAVQNGAGLKHTLKKNVTVVPRRRLIARTLATSNSSLVDSSSPTSQLGDKISKFLASPFDYAAFPGRATLGAVISFPKAAENFQTEVDRLSMLIQDPRPIPEKQQILVEELESRLAEYVEKGISLEADILASASAVLPVELQQMVPQELKDFYGRPLGTATVVETTVTSYSTTGNEREEVVVEPAWTAPPSSFLANQSAAEMVDLKEAVETLKLSLDALSANSGGSGQGILKMNLADARDSLARRLQQLSPVTRTSQDPSVQSAIKESTTLVQEVDDLGL